MSANDVTVNPPTPPTAWERERDTCVAPPTTQPERNERESAHATVARTAGGPRVSKEQEFDFYFPIFWGQRWLISLILNSQASVFNFDTRRSFLVGFLLRFWMEVSSLGPRASQWKQYRLRLETHTPAAPWAASSWIMLYWEAFTAVFFHNTRRHAALWELPVCNSNKRDEPPPNHPAPNNWQFQSAQINHITVDFVIKCTLSPPIKSDLWWPVHLFYYIIEYWITLKISR